MYKKKSAEVTSNRHKYSGAMPCVLPQILKFKDICHSQFVALLIHLLDYIIMVGTGK